MGIRSDCGPRGARAFSSTSADAIAINAITDYYISWALGIWDTQNK